MLKPLCFVLAFSTVVVAQNAAVSFEQLTIAATAIGFDQATYLPAGQPVPQRCIGFLETATVRIRVDGTVPTAAIGTLVPIGAKVEVVGQDNIRKFRAIRTGGTSGVLPTTCYPQ